MNRIHSIAVCLLALAPGCAQMGTKQSDTNTTTRYEIDPTGKTNAIVSEVRETATRASGRALFSAASTFEGYAAKQDGKNQGLTIDRSSQKSDVDRLIDMVGKLAPMAASMYGIPMAPAAQPPPLPAAPPGRKWVLVPTDDPSTPQPEDPQP